jgi:excisionase family DNA binding protein
MLLTIKDLSTWLNIKPSTLYLWAAQGKVPCQKIHGLIRFDREKVKDWLDSFERKQPGIVPALSRTNRGDIDQVIEAAKRDAYTLRHRETRPTASPKGKEVDRGAR